MNGIFFEVCILFTSWNLSFYLDLLHLNTSAC